MEGDWSPLARAYNPIRCGNIDGTDKDLHDKAIWRAMKSTYRPNKGVIGDKHKTLFIGRLNLKTNEAKLTEKFSKYGSIKRIRVVRDLVTGYSKGYAFIEYENQSQAAVAHKHANGLNVDSSAILVEYELERTMPGWIPRRFGGGFGGKKESGQLRFGGRDRPFKKPFVHQHSAQKSSFRPDSSGPKRKFKDYDRPRPYDRYRDAKR